MTPMLATMCICHPIHPPLPPPHCAISNVCCGANLEGNKGAGGYQGNSASSNIGIGNKSFINGSNCSTNNTVQTLWTIWVAG